MSVNSFAAHSKVSSQEQETSPRLERSASLTGALLSDAIAKELTVLIEMNAVFSYLLLTVQI